ncbi:MAG: undecaprenyl-diphosphate phosphatase [Deltaproteobacteria bacterium]|nr:undecaprenyl-diphosphate phosphatase [Deltaproteobacteria bacterium]
MSTFAAILLGIIQGLTEFLPISSSGHLVVFQNLLGYSEPELLFDSALHMGTLVAVCLYFRKDLELMFRDSWGFIIRWSKREVGFQQIKETPHVGLTLAVIVGTLPTAVIGILFRSSIERLFGSVSFAALMLLCTGGILASSKWISPGKTRGKAPGLPGALLVGTAQGIAILPGISRSGTTIVCGMALGLSREMAARFSFLLSIPAIMGALTLQMSTEGLDSVGLLPLFMGFATSALVGLFALKLLMAMVRKGRLFYFAPYCFLVGLLILLI